MKDVIKHRMENAVQVVLYTPDREWMFATRPESEGHKVDAFLHSLMEAAT